MPKKIDAITKRRIKNKSDELAVKNGCFMDLARGQFVCDWIEEYCHLYEGVKPLEDGSLPKMELMKWQRELLMRLFGWQRYSKEHKCNIRRFRKAGIWIPKKNGKSPLLAAVGLYMLMGEGIHGAKCFSVAKDGKQAMISHMHAIQMVQASDAFKTRCVVNKSSGRIVDEILQAFYSVISAENIEGQQGLNAVFIGVDETAVVDQRTMAVLEYATAHPKEPIQMEVSTAGNNTEGYGKKQFDYGRQVERGLQLDDQYFHLEYSVDDGLSEKQFEDDFDNQIAKCNPSIGTTIYLEELKTSFNRAKGSIANLADFMMYRANRWQNAQNPWLDIAAWQSSIKSELYSLRRLLPRHEFKGYGRGPRLDAFGGLDLSRVNDMSAFVLAVKMPDGKTQFIVRLWMSERYAKTHSHLAPFTEWAKQGFIKLTPGSTVDHGIVAGDVRRLCRHFNVIAIAADQMFAERPMQEICEGVYSEHGEEVDAGIGCERAWFAQTAAGYAKPTEDFEAALLDGSLILPNNTCLNWQASHVEVAEDSHGSKRPIKPKGRKGEELEYKKVDGIVALIMAYSLIEKETNAYEKNGVFSV